MGVLVGIALGVLAIYYLLPKIQAAGGVQNLVQSLQSSLGGIVQTPQESAAVASITGTSTQVAGAAPRATGAAQAQATSSVMQAATAGASAIPVVGSTIATVLSSLRGLVSSIFKGADPTQVASAEIQQVYDVLALNLCSLGGAVIDPKSHIATAWGPKMLPQSLLVDAINATIQGCDQAEAQAEATGKVDVQTYQRSLNNIQTDMTLYAQAVQANQGYAQPCTIPVNLVTARQLYFSTLLPSSLIGGGGWYPWSVQTGQSLTDQFVQLLPQGVILA
jgi:hypothetical protein